MKVRSIMLGILAMLPLTGCAAGSGDESAHPRLPDGGSTSDDGGPGPAFDADYEAGLDPDGGCATASVSARKGPIDLIFVIDQSDSMQQEVASVKANINALSGLLEKANMDYRLVMIAAYLATDAKGIDKYGVCVAPPLAGSACGNRAPTYRTVQRRVGSFTQFYDILSTYDSTDPKTKWSDVLRPNSIKAFVIVTDDNAIYPWSPTSTAEWPSPEASIAAFDAALLSRGGGTFGTASKRKYVMYPICGASAGSPDVKCPSAENNGPSYVGLAKLTGGKTFPVCDTNFGPVFTTIGSTLASSVACTLDVPAPPTGEKIDLGKINVATDCDGKKETVLKDDSAGCDAGANGWQYSADKTQVQLCGAACAKLKADLACKVTVTFGCDTLVR